MIGSLGDVIFISIHAPVRGATAVGDYIREKILISIHAPVRGATPTVGDFLFYEFLFQFTLPCGERQSLLVSISYPSLFQFTLPCGERHSLLRGRIKEKLFQFTLPCGERQAFSRRPISAHPISIHAPVRGATSKNINRDILCFYFNSRSRAGSDATCNKVGTVGNDFNSRSRAGSDACIKGGTADAEQISIHAPVRGATAL